MAVKSKICKKCWFPQMGTKQNLASVPSLSLFVEKLSTHLTMHCLKGLFNMNNHIDLVGCVTFVERIFS